MRRIRYEAYFLLVKAFISTSFKNTMEQVQRPLVK